MNENSYIELVRERLDRQDALARDHYAAAVATGRDRPRARRTAPQGNGFRGRFALGRLVPHLH